MAKTAKKDSTLTLEEKLEQALVPNTEYPYKIPDNWCWVYTPIVFEIEYGKGLSTKELTLTGYPVFGANGQIGYYNEFMFENPQALMSCRGAYSGTMNLSFPNSYITSNSLIISSSKLEITPQFICYLFESQDKKKLVSGTAQPQVTVQAFQYFPIPLIPMKEQQRIVDRIESLFAKLDEAKEKAQAVVDGFEERKAAILHKAFTGELTEGWRKKHKFSSEEFFYSIQQHLSAIKKKKQKKVQNSLKDRLKKKIPKEWLLVDLDSISKQITDGEHNTPKRVESYCGYYLLSARNIHDDALRLDNVDYIDGVEYSIISKRCNPIRGDILLSCSGSVGRCCVVCDDNNYCMVRSAAMISQYGCNSRFIMYMIQSDGIQEQIRLLSKQTAQANLFLGAIASLMIPLPSIEEQNELVERLDTLLFKMQQSKEIAEQAIDQINTLKKVILARAFRGELGTNDPKDESAVELLKKVL